MAIINYDFYCGEDKYSDGSIEDYLRYLAENQIDINTLDPLNKTYPVVYHMSHLRENIINWYPIGPDQSVLEIGSGCGAITGALCRKAGKVVSVELSKRRAEINYQRNMQADNLTIYVGNQNDIRFEEKFDYVILNGVFEYAMSFTESPDPYRTFLETTRGFLKENGKLLIAIENRLGLKYFTGSAEDHTGNYFLGLNNYPGNRTVRTFSKTEWMKLLDSCDLKYKFYYPYPDYKFPTEIFTDRTLSVNGYGKPYYNLEDNRYEWLQELELTRTFMEEGVIGAFANSFFLEICAEENFANVDYCKLSCDRKEDTRIVTSILRDGDHIWVEKQAANEASIPHVERIYKNSTLVLTGGIQNLAGTYEPGRVAFPHISFETLSDRLLTLLAQGHEETVKMEIKNFFADYFASLQEQTFDHSAAFCEVFGPVQIPEPLTAVCGSNIDLIFENLYCAEDGYQIIDPEWVFSFGIPKNYVIWRAVHDFYEKHTVVQQQLDQDALLAYLGVEPTYGTVFAQWNAHFVYQWLKGSSLESFARPKHPLSMDHVISVFGAKTKLSCCLYYDCGEGFTESEKLVAEIPLLNDSFRVSFDLSKIKYIKALRFDPVEGKAVRCVLRSEQASLTAVNACGHSDGYDVFSTDDPMYQVHLSDNENPGFLTISGKIFFLSEQERAHNYELQLHTLYKQRFELQSALEDVRHENSLQHAAMEHKEQENVRLFATLEDVRQENSVLQSQYAQKEAKLQSIYQSKGWKLLEFIRRIKRFFLR